MQSTWVNGQFQLLLKAKKPECVIFATCFFLFGEIRGKVSYFRQFCPHFLKDIGP